MNTAVNNSTQSPTSSVSAGAPLKPIKKNKVPLAYIIGGLLLLLLVIGGGVAFMLSKQRQDIRQQASGGEDTYGCGGYPTAQLCGQESGGKCTWNNNECKPVEAPTGPGDGQFTHIDGCDGTVCNDDDGCSCSMTCNTKFPKKGESCGGTKPEALDCGQYSSAQLCGQGGQGKCTWSNNQCVAAGVNPGDGGCNNLALAVCTNTSGCTWSNGACTAASGDSCVGAGVVCQTGACSTADQISANASGRCGNSNQSYCCKPKSAAGTCSFSSECAPSFSCQAGKCQKQIEVWVQ